MNKSTTVALFFILMLVTSCARLDSASKESFANTRTEETKPVNLPQNMKNAVDIVAFFEEGSSFELTITKDEKILYDGKELTQEALPDKITSSMKKLSIDQRVIFIKSDAGLKYGSLVEIIRVIRSAGVDKIYFVVSKTQKGDPDGVFEIKIPAIPDDSVLVKPNPLTLVAALDEEGNITLNREPYQSPESLIAILTQVFHERENNGVFMEGTNEIEKTTFIQASPSARYGEVAKLIDAVTGAGARPVGLQIDDLNWPPKIVDPRGLDVSGRGDRSRVEEDRRMGAFEEDR